MFNYELLPKLANNQKYQDIKQPRQQEEYQDTSKNSSNCVLLFKLPPLIQNSALIRQRLNSGAKDTLAAASINTGVSVPLAANCTRVSESSIAPLDGKISNAHSTPKQRVNPNMVSVVRPVPNSYAQQQQQQFEQSEKGGALEMKSDSCCKEGMPAKSIYLVDELMRNEERYLRSVDNELEQLNLELLNLSMPAYPKRDPSELDSRQQVALSRREQVQLNGGIRKQHEFVLAKLEQRKRGLQIVQAVWEQQDFKRAMERLVDLYNEGLSFRIDNHIPAKGDIDFGKHVNICVQQKEQLSSLNTTLVADVLGVIVLRPKLWSLDTCQLLLPIIINDFLNSTNTNCSTQAKSYRDDQAELAMRALKLILTHFSSLILSTLQQQQQLDELNLKSTGVDLNREERFNRCSSCFKLLQEARAQLIRWRPLARGPTSNRLLSMSRELEQLFNSALQLGNGQIGGCGLQANKQQSHQQTTCQRRGH